MVNAKNNGPVFFLSQLLDIEHVEPTVDMPPTEGADRCCEGGIDYVLRTSILPSVSRDGWVSLGRKNASTEKDQEWQHDAKNQVSKRCNLLPLTTVWIANVMVSAISVELLSEKHMIHTCHGAKIPCSYNSKM